MCLLVVMHRIHPELPLVVAANRDEWRARPSRGMGVLRRGDGAEPRVLGGRDEDSGGTWLSIADRGLVAALTNRPGAPRAAGFRSRGELPLRAQGYATARSAAAGLGDELDGLRYRGCWLMVADRDALYYLEVADDARRPVARALAPGLHVLENRPLGEPSAKLARVRRWMRDAERLAPQALERHLRIMLSDRRAPDAAPWSAINVDAGDYGTRSSAIVSLAETGPPRVYYTDGPPDRSPWRRADGLWGR